MFASMWMIPGRVCVTLRPWMCHCLSSGGRADEDEEGATRGSPPLWLSVAFLYAALLRLWSVRSGGYKIAFYSLPLPS